MILKKHNWFIIIFIIILLRGTIIYSIYINPLNAFKRKFNFKLPDTIEILKKSYLFNGNILKLSVCFGIDDYPIIEIRNKRLRW